MITEKNQENKSCVILDSILTNSTLQKVIGIDTVNSKNNKPSIRVVDLESKKFANCELLYFITPNTLPVEVFVVPEPTYSLNTGQYRDIVILHYEETNDLIKINLTAAHIKNQAEKEGIPFFEFDFVKDKNGGLHIENVSIKQIRESRPAVDYDGIK